MNRPYPETDPRPPAHPNLPLAATALAPYDASGGSLAISRATPELSDDRSVLTPELVISALKRYWLWILLAWSIGAVGLAFIAYKYVTPTYESVATLLVYLPSGTLTSGGGDGSVGREYDRDMASHRDALTSGAVIGKMLDDYSNLAGLPLLRGAGERGSRIEAIQEIVSVQFRQPSTFIFLRARTDQPSQGAELVNRLAETYVSYANSKASQKTGELVNRLQSFRTKVQAEIDGIEDQLKQAPMTGGGINEETFGEQFERSQERLIALMQRQTEQEIAVVQTEAEVAFLREELARLGQGGGSGGDGLVAPRLEEIAVLFQANPEVRGLEEQLGQIEVALKEIRRDAANPGIDPQYQRLNEARDQVEEQLDTLWDRTYSQAQSGRVVVPTGTDSGLQGLRAELSRALRKLAQDRAVLQVTETDLEQFQDRIIESEDQSIRLILDQNKMAARQDVLNRIDLRMVELKSDRESSQRVIELSSPALPNNQASNVKRYAAMAGGPMLWLGLLLVGFVLLEMKQERVGNPQEMSSRVPVEVLGVVPPLPRIRQDGPQQRAALESGSRPARQFQGFLQSLEHLRVLLCVDPQTRQFVRRSLMITSACSGEGKTTLASQLAARCAESGMLTLLIDADLRNPSLSRMFAAQDQPGLIEVLRGQRSAEAVTQVIEQGGGFHFLPAGGSGSPGSEADGQNPIRLLQGEAIGQILATLQGVFDVVLIDTPPVLPVPDALLIGRYTDGTAISVRYDTSRYPLLKQAHAKLTSVGIPVLGAIINGFQSPEASQYAGYYVSSKTGGMPEPSGKS